MNQKKNIYLFYVSNNLLWRYFPNSVLSLCNPLIKEGFNPIVIDTVIEGSTKVTLEDPLFVGFSIYTDAAIATALRIAEGIRREYPSLPLVWGGPHVIMLPEQTAAHPLVDAACYAEGEIAIVDLANAIAQGQSSFEGVRGILWKNKEGKVIRNLPAPYLDMDEIELHPYHLLNDKFYSLREGKIYYEASRGCPFQCTFCSYDHTKWRCRSEEKVIGDFIKLEEKFAPEEVQVIDATHFIDVRWVAKIWSGKISHGLKFKWETNCRFDTLCRMDEAILDVISMSGCYQLRLGAESGSQKILDYLNKGITVEQIIKGVRLCRKHNINPLLSFIIGSPQESKDDVDLTMRLIDTLRKEFPGIQINGLFQFQLHPNTKAYADVQKTYNIPQPKSLDEWAHNQPIEMRRRDFPWLTNAQYREYMLLSTIVSYLFFSEKLRMMPRTQRLSIPAARIDFCFILFKLCDSIVRKIFVYLRWDKKITACAIEWDIWNFIRKYILKLY